MRIAIYQCRGHSADTQANLALLRNKALEAAGKGAKLLILPETFVSGYDIGDAMTKLAQPADGPYGDAMAAVAKEAGLTLAVGYPELHGEAVYNSVLVAGPEGIIGNARKTHLYGTAERKVFSPGEQLTVIRFPELTIGLLICYDIEFPEAVRELALAGAQLIVTPTAIMEPYHYVPNFVVPVRAWENSVFVAYANRCGKEGDLTYCGLSCVVNPMGEVISRAPRREEAMLVVDLNLKEIEEARRINPYLADRRSSLYEKTVTEIEAPALNR